MVHRSMEMTPIVVHYDYTKSLERMKNLDLEYMNLVHERNEALNALSESEQRYKALSDAGIEGIIIHRGGEIIAVNQAMKEMVGYTDYPPESIWDVIHPEDVEEVKRRAQDGLVGSYKARLRRKDGTSFVAFFRVKYVSFNGCGMCRAVIVTPWLDRHE